MKTAVFVDVSNVYYCINKKFPGRKLDYERYLASVSDGHEILRAYAYGSQINEEAHGFITCLKKIGYQPNFKSLGTSTRRVCWDAAICVDTMKLLDRLERVVIGSASPDIVPLVSWLKDRGVQVEVVACGINKDLKAAASSFVEIDDSWLEVRDEKPKTADGVVGIETAAGQTTAL